MNDSPDWVSSYSTVIVVEKDTADIISYQKNRADNVKLEIETN
ncbi:hypothetical protein [Sphingobacterium sp. IITKGP-BTPF85]|nr:hypothetical protein [Sphingobacterium sp. IITKGP-BTPF85]